MNFGEENLLFPDEAYSFDFWCGKDSINKIVALKHRDFQNQKLGSFNIYLFDRDFRWYHGLLGALIEVLYHFKQRGLFWEKFSITVRESDGSFTRPLLHTVNSLNLFRQISLNDELRYDDEESEGMDGESYFSEITMFSKQLEYTHHNRTFTQLGNTFLEI